ncbi:putative prophage protein [Escherichia coli]|nr:putative prophage protein [Escherichia coli]
MLGYSKLFSIKTPHGVLSKQFRYPGVKGNEVSMDTIDLGNNESLVYGVFPNQDGTFTAMTYTKSKTFKTESGARRWLERNSGG